MRAWFLVGCSVLAGCRLNFDARAELATDSTTAEDPGDSLVAGAPSAMSEACASRMLTVIRGGAAADDAMALQVAMQLAGCGSASVRTVSQDAAGILEPGTNRPLLAIDDLGIIGGGDAFQRAFAYLAVADTPLVFDETPARIRVIVRSTGAVIVDELQSTFNATHDLALVMLVYEPLGGASVLALVGRGAEGTRAAGYWFETFLLPVIGTVTQRWYVLDWQSTDGDPAPSTGDTFTIVANG